MVDAAFGIKVGVKGVERAVLTETQARGNVRIFQETRFGKDAVDFIFLVHVEVARDNNRCTFGNLTYLADDQLGTLTACRDSDVVHVEVEEKEGLIVAGCLRSKLAPSADADASCIPTQSRSIRGLANPKVTLV